MRELSLNVLDIAQNSVSAGASLIELGVDLDRQTHELTLSVIDNGCGMTAEQLAAVRDPFFTTRTTRKVGMGVPLFKMAAEMTGGSFSIESAVGFGTTVKAFFKTDHVDFTPLGDMPDTVVMLITMNLHIDFVYRVCADGETFTLDTRELKTILGDVPLNDPGIARWIKDYIIENTAKLTEVQE